MNGVIYENVKRVRDLKKGEVCFNEWPGTRRYILLTPSVQPRFGNLRFLAISKSKK